MKYRTIKLAHDIPALVLSATDRKVLRALKPYAGHLEHEGYRQEVVDFLAEVDQFQSDMPELVGELTTSVEQEYVDVDQIVARSLKKETNALLAGKHAPIFDVMGIAESTNMWIFRYEDGSPYRVRKEIQVYNSRRTAREAFDSLSESKKEQLEIHKTVAVLGR